MTKILATFENSQKNAKILPNAYHFMARFIKEATKQEPYVVQKLGKISQFFSIFWSYLVTLHVNAFSAGRQRRQVLVERERAQGRLL